MLGETAPSSALQSARGPVQTTLACLAQVLLGSGSRCQLYVGGEGRQKRNIEALSECSPRPGRFLHGVYPNVPTCVPRWIMGRGKEKQPLPGPCHHQPLQTIPPLRSRCKQSLGLHSGLTRWAGETCTLKVSLSLLRTSALPEVGAGRGIWLQTGLPYCDS